MAASAAPPGRKKVIHQLGTPFSTVAWPEISSDDQDTILELLCNLLNPIGKHRRNHITPSKGKRAAKRKRQQNEAAAPDEGRMSLDPPSKPELCSHVDVGFNAITKAFQSEAQENSQQTKQQPYSMVFVSRGNQAPAFNSHFAQMIAANTKDLPDDRKTRLVGFSKPCSDKLSACLGIARVSSVAIRVDAPGSEAVWEIVKQTVKPVHAEWLTEARSTDYRNTQITSIETSVGPKKNKATPIRS